MKHFSRLMLLTLGLGVRRGCRVVPSAPYSRRSDWHKLNLGLFVAVFLLLSGSSPAWADDTAPPPGEAPWTTVGAAGTVDPASMGVVAYGNPLGIPAQDTAAVTFSLLGSGTATIRYNVVSVPGILEPLEGVVGFSARYLAESADERVVVTLNSYNFSNGSIATVGTPIDSNNYPPSSSFQMITTGCNVILDFAHYSYFFTVELTRPSVTLFPRIVIPPRPALGMIQLGGVGMGCLSF